MQEFPKVGVGLLIFKDGKLLLGKRKSSHGDGKWQSGGGHLEFGEEFEEAVRRETREEIGIKLKNIKLLKVTNDIFPKDHKHYVTLFFTCEYASGEVQVMEPEKCDEWKWFEVDKLPSNLFLPYDKLIKEIEK